MLIPNNTRQINILAKQQKFNPTDTLYAWNGLTGVIEPYPCQIHPREDSPGRHVLWDIYPYQTQNLCIIAPNNRTSIGNRRLATSKAEAWFYYKQELEQQIIQTKHRLEKLESNLTMTIQKTDNSYLPAQDAAQAMEIANLIAMYEEAFVPNRYGRIERKSIKEKTFDAHCKAFMEKYKWSKQDCVNLCKEYLKGNQ